MSVEFKNTSLPDIIELRNINQSYGDKVIIKDFNLLVEDKPNMGQFEVILGESGCGKSTILRYIAGLQKPTSGEVFIHAKPRTNEPISMVFQRYSSIPWLSVLQNVILPLDIRNEGDKKEREQKAREMIKTVDLEGHEDKYAVYPLLSGGQLQRVAIARSLISNPEILLMDEPFGALDNNTRNKMQVMLAKLWEKYQSTIIFVTHDIREAVFLADNIYIMKSNPAYIEKLIHIDLPLVRDRYTKNEKKFLDLVDYVENALLNINVKK